MSNAGSICKYDIYMEAIVYVNVAQVGSLYRLGQTVYISVINAKQRNRAMEILLRLVLL